MLPFWLVQRDLRTYSHISARTLAANGIRIHNDLAWRRAVPSLSASGVPVPFFGAGCHALPVDMPPLQLDLPTRRWQAPDYIKLGVYTLVSSKLRAALSLPAPVAEYPAIDLLNGDEAARSQDYRLLRVLAHQPAIDLGRTEHEVDETVTPDGRTSRILHVLHAIVLRADLAPETEMFYADELGTNLFAVDALAERVMRAGCTGIWFQDPRTAGLGDHPIRIRTADGIGRVEPGRWSKVIPI